jgi:hypothetical protein
MSTHKLKMEVKFISIYAIFGQNISLDFFTPLIGAPQEE